MNKNKEGVLFNIICSLWKKKLNIPQFRKDTIVFFIVLFLEYLLYRWEKPFDILG